MSHTCYPPQTEPALLFTCTHHPDGLKPSDVTVLFGREYDRRPHTATDCIIEAVWQEKVLTNLPRAGVVDCRETLTPLVCCLSSRKILEFSTGRNFDWQA